MNYLYHRVPEKMQGDFLYPLNVLKDKNPEVYLQEVKKYAKRERLLVKRVGILDCAWNDVIHLTAVPPAQIKKNLTEGGFGKKPLSFFKIPIEMIQGEQSVAFTYRRDEQGISEINEYEKFDPARMDVYSTVPRETAAHYKQCKKESKKPFLFRFTPHILFRGSIDIRGLEIITV